MATEVDLAARFHENNTLAGRRVEAISPGGGHVIEGPWDLVDSGTPGFPGANTASVIDHAEVTDLDAALAWFRGRGIEGAAGRFLLRADRDAHLVAELARRGAPPLFTEPVLELPPDRPLPPAIDGPLAIREVTAEADLERYGPVNWPPEQHYIGQGIARQARDLGFTMLLGTLEGAPIACSMVVVTGELAAAYNVGVEPPYRRRGFGEAMTWAAFRAGRDRGARHFWLGASDMGYPLYLKMGFVPRFEYRAIGLPPEA
ncbi:MAG: GNAT family N-acetyltransferase [Dehalococcoidia bacterium]